MATGNNHDGQRASIQECLDAGRWAEARAKVERFWAAQRSPRAAAYVCAVFETLRPHVPLAPLKVAMARSFTLEPVAPVLKAAGLACGLDLEMDVGDFNAYAQEFLNQDSFLYRKRYDAVILAVQTRDAAPEIWRDYCSLSRQELSDVKSRAVETFRGLAAAFRRRSKAPLIVHGLESPSQASAGILDAQSAGQRDAIAEMNAGIRAEIAGIPDVYFLDYDNLVARYGRDAWHDEAKWATINMPFSADCMISLAEEWIRFLCPATGKIAKVIVTDLDNTLWGGVVGEEGIEGIKIGREYPGNFYWDVQRALLDCYQRGILLAIASKNNRADAVAVFERHPGMLLKLNHFSAECIDWTDKAHNLRQIAAMLNVGVESLAFLDDNPVERELIRTHVPEAIVVALPEDAAGYARAIRDNPFLQRLKLSEEDLQRNRYYAEQQKREELMESTASLEDFYESLQQVVTIERLHSGNAARIAQLTQKTNQFNVTTKRYTEAVVRDLAAKPGWDVYGVSVSDRFGDNGLTGVAITHWDGTWCEIDTFLLSCRVIARTVETAMLSFLASDCRARGVNTLRGWFVPTKKNAPAADFYAKHGFEQTERNGDSPLWAIDLKSQRIDCPRWIEMRTPVLAYAAD